MIGSEQRAPPSERTRERPPRLAFPVIAALALSVLAIAGNEQGARDVCAAPDAPLTCATPTMSQSDPTAIPSGQCAMPTFLRIVVVGDYGACTETTDECEAEAAVARAIRDVNPDAVIAVGDLNYDHGEAGVAAHPPPAGANPVHISQNNSRVFPPGLFTEPAAQADGHAHPPSPPDPTAGVELYESFIDDGRFLPTWGNHDYRTENAGPAKEFFQKSLPYAVQIGPVVVVGVDSNAVAVGDADPDGVVKAQATAGTAMPPSLSGQEDAVISALKLARACWRIMFMHHPPFHTAKDHRKHADSAVFDFIDEINKALGTEDKKLDAVLAGHLHALNVYFREEDKIFYVLSGAGGRTPYEINKVRGPISTGTVTATPAPTQIPTGTYTPGPTATARVPVVPADKALHGFAMIDVWTRPHDEQIRFWLVTLEEKPIPEATNWYDNWETTLRLGPEYPPFGQTTPCAEYPHCVANKPCTPETTPIAVATLDSTLPICENCFGIGWIEVPRVSCPITVTATTTPGTPGPENRRLMSARITVPTCDSPLVPSCTYNCPCPFRAIARNEMGHEIASVCMEPVQAHPFDPSLTTHFVGTTACLFDEFTTPTSWSIGPEYELDSFDCDFMCRNELVGVEYKVEYFCCNCFATFPTNTPTATY